MNFNAADFCLATSPDMLTLKTNAGKVLNFNLFPANSALIMHEVFSNNASLVTVRSIFLTPPRLVELLDMVTVILLKSTPAFSRIIH